MGIAKDGSKKDNFQRGVELRGCSLSLSLSLCILVAHMLSLLYGYNVWRLVKVLDSK